MKNYPVYLSLMALAATAMACSEEGPVQPSCATPPEITAVEISHAACSGDGGRLEVIASGGSGVLIYSLNDSPFQTDNAFDELPAGTYTVKVKDEENCQSAKEVEIEEAGALSFLVEATTESGCGHSEGSVILNVTGGEAAYSFSLNGEDFQQEGTFNGLEAGAYTAHVKDAAGCEETATFSINTGISFEASVKSIIETNCAISGCHVAGTGRADFTQFSEIKARAATIKSYTQSGYMPAQGSGKTLSSEEIAAIACWVDDGALQN